MSNKSDFATGLQDITRPANPMDIPEYQLEEVAKSVFSKPPGPPNSVDLQLTDDSDEGSLSEDILLSMYIDLAAIGCEILWGKHVKIFTLSKEQFDTLQRYMNSFGVNLIVKCNEDAQDPWETVKNGGTIKFLRFSIQNVELPTQHSV